MNVQPIILRDAMKMDICQDARIERQRRAHNPIAQASAFIINWLRSQTGQG